MTELSPRLAAALANDVYTLRTDRDVKAFVDKYKTQISGEDAVRTSGISGGLVFIKKESSFGLLALGTGEFRAQAFILLRGTETLYDALTDANIGVAVSKTGYPVHAGFNSCFNTILPEIQSFMSKMGGSIRLVHCVGHSLGGALATLASDWIEKNTRVNTRLYTFGSPRVGFAHFCRGLTSELGTDAIYRVHHKTDVVSMVPVWPYLHVPEPGKSYHLNSPGSIPGGEFHKMANYMRSVEGANWARLRDNVPPPYTDDAIASWLDSDGVISLTFNTIELINRAIVYVLKKIGQAALVLMQSAFCTTFTLLDQLSFILHKSLDIAAETSIWVQRLIRRIMQLLGKTARSVAEMTAGFIRDVFTELLHRINDIVRKAISVLPL